MAVAIGRSMGRLHEVELSYQRLMRLTNRGRATVAEQLEEVCGPNGLFDRIQRGGGEVNLYRIKASLRSRNLDGMRSEKHDVPSALWSRKANTTRTQATPVSPSLAARKPHTEEIVQKTLACPLARIEWQKVVAALEADRTVSPMIFGNYVLSAIPIGLRGTGITVQSPTAEMARWLQVRAQRAASALGLTVLVTTPCLEG